MFFKQGRVLAVAAVLAMVVVSAPPSVADPVAWSEPDRVVTVAGTGQPGNTGDGGDAEKATVAAKLSIDLAPDGSLYLLDRETGALRVVDPDGRIDRVPGTEGIKATDVDAVDGAVYLVTATELWRVAAGQAALVLGGFTDAVSVVAGSGGVYVADELPGGARIRRVAQDGSVTVVAGVADEQATAHSRREGEPAAGAELRDVRGLALGPQGKLYFTAEATPETSSVLTINDSGALDYRVYEKTLPKREGGDGLAVGDDGRVYVLEVKYGLGGVHVLGPDEEHDVAGPNVFDAQDVAVGPDGDVHVAAHGRVLLLRDDATKSEAKVSPAEDPWADQEPKSVRTVAGPAGNPGRLRLAGAVKDVAVGTDGAVHVVDDSRVRTVLGSTRVARRLVGPLSVSGEVFVARLAAAEDGALYALAVLTEKGTQLGTAQTFGSLVLLAHPDRNEVPAVVGTVTRRGDMLMPTAIAAVGNRLYLDTGAVVLLEPDGRVRNVSREVTAGPFTMDPTGAVHYTEDGRLFRVAPKGQPKQLAKVGEVFDVAVAPDRTVYVATGDGIRAVTPDGAVTTVLPDAATMLATDAHGNLYFADSEKVRVLVRPGEPTESPSRLSAPLVIAVGLAVVLAAVGFFVIRARRRGVKQ